MTRTVTAPNEERVRPEDDGHPGDVLEILQRLHDDRGGLIAVLEAIQTEYGYLPEKALRTVSEQTGRSLVDVYGIATFYRSFSLKPRGKHLVSACLGTACHVRGAPKVVEELRRQLGIRAGETTPDGEFTLETVNCLGACAIGPVVVIDGHYFSKVRKQRVRQLLDQALRGFDQGQPGGDTLVFPIDVSCIRCNHSLMDESLQVDGRAAIRVIVSAGGKQGWLRISSLYGSGTVLSEHDIAPETVVSFFCPHCHADLAGACDCAACNAPMVPMTVRAGGIVQICSRRGCKGGRLDLDGINVDSVPRRMEG